MYSYLLQDWISLHLNPQQPSITQSEADWMSFQPYQDIIFWLDVRGVTLADAKDIFLAYETAPAKDEGLFLPMVEPVSLSNLVGGSPTVSKVILSLNPNVPLARWVRWRLFATGEPRADWGVTIRIHCAANAVGVL